MDEMDVPYYKQYGANATRGLIAGLVVAVFFIGLGLFERFVLKKKGEGRRPRIQTRTATFSKSYGASVHLGKDNPGVIGD